MKVYDVSVALGARTHSWDGGPAPRLETLTHVDRGDAYTLSRVVMSAHSGTHVDAPAHAFGDGATVDSLSPDVLVGPALVVCFEGAGQVTAADLDALGVDGRVPRVLFKTPGGALWARDGFQREIVGLAEDAAARLVELGVVLVGIDYLSIEAYEADVGPVHRTLLGAGVVVLEGLDLREVPGGEYLLACAPLKLEGADGAPARVFLVGE